MPDPDPLQVPLQVYSELSRNYVMSANKYSHTFASFFSPPQLKTHQPNAWRNVSGLHPELHKQMCEQPQLETPFRRKLEVGSFPNKPDDSVKVKRTNRIICPVLPYYLREFICWSGAVRLLREAGTRDLPLGTVGWGRAHVHPST